MLTTRQHIRRAIARSIHHKDLTRQLPLNDGIKILALKTYKRGIIFPKESQLATQRNTAARPKITIQPPMLLVTEVHRWTKRFRRQPSISEIKTWKFSMQQDTATIATLEERIARAHTTLSWIWSNLKEGRQDRRISSTRQRDVELTELFFEYEGWQSSIYTSSNGTGQNCRLYANWQKRTYPGDYNATIH